MYAPPPFRFRVALAAFAALFALTLRPHAAHGTESYPDPFEDAQFVPSSITQYFCFVDGGESLAGLMQSSLAPGLKTIYETSHSGRSWRDLAASTGIDPSKLFDLLVSRRVTLVTDQEREARPRPGEAPDYSRWVLMARVDESFAKDLLKMLGGRVREFVDNAPLYSADNGSLRFAYREGRFYLAAAEGEALLKSMLAKSMAPALADDDEFREARRVGPGDFGMFKRGTGEVHWQAGAAKVRHDRMNFNFISKHEAHGVQQEPDDAINLGLLRTLSENAIYVGVERTPPPNRLPREHRTGPGLLPLVPIASANPSLLEELGPTMFTVIELPEESDSSAHGIPAMTVGIEMRQPYGAIGELDTFMGEATARLARHRRDKAALPEQAPAVVNAGGRPDELRSAEWRGGGMPMKMLGLDGTWPQRVVWSSVISENRTWWVASTDERCQRRIVDKLKSFTPQCSSSTSTQARGAIYGQRLASLLAQWPAVKAGAENPFMAELFAWRELLTSVSAIGWRISQSCPETTETSISVSWGGKSLESRR